MEAQFFQDGKENFSNEKRAHIYFKHELQSFLIACFINNLRMVIEQRESIYEYRILCKSSGNYVDVERR